MTFGEAIDYALNDLGLGTTEHSHNQYDAQLMQYANACVLELTKDARPVAHDETVSAVDGLFDISALSHPLYNLLRVRAGSRIFHTRAEGEKIYLCEDYTGTVSVTYEYYYELETSKVADIPLLQRYHQLVPIYMAAQFQMAGDRWQQAQGRTKLQIFQELRSNLKKVQHGATDSYKFKNRGW